jgi:hypothetical protein
MKGRKTMIAKRMISISLIVVGCLWLTAYSKGTMAEEPNVVPEVKGNVTQAKDSKSPTDMSGYPLIGHLKTKNKLITIRRGPDGPLYTVETKDGKILAVNLPAEKLYAKFPELKKVLERGMAIEDASNRLRNKEDLKAKPIYKEIP